jgi:hypothetical protein
MPLYATPFKALHTRRLDVQDAQVEELIFATDVADLAACQNEHAFTIWDDHEGKQSPTVVACGGVLPIWQGRAAVWAFLGDDARRHMPYLTLFTRGVLNRHPAHRIEATVLTGWRPAHRWVEALGFELETPKGMKSYDPQRRTMSLYARVRDGGEHDRR